MPPETREDSDREMTNRMLEPHFLSDSPGQRARLFEERNEASKEILRRLAALEPQEAARDDLTAWSAVVAEICDGMSHRMTYQVMLRVALAIHYGKFGKVD